ncbi:branched-chain amino acid aminotransferase [Desulfurella sp.]|uniref:branched-chain amino acid aminotransferase n=1 Tax=Desulfurella sp. TaxID=1962857 RepID=UPI0025C69789|nr:branched-chain amino acid aminotransferase [Desulfurella sp.]
MQIAYLLKPKSQRRKEQLKPTQPLPFGQLRTDHMFLIDYEDGEWQNARIVPYEPFTISPGAIALHYGQALFEGAKAFMHPDNEIYTFRIDKNAKRLNKSAEILCMPSIDENLQIEAIHALIDVDRLWLPIQNGASLYIRPFMFATEDSLGVHPSKSYRYAIILSPSGPYYPEGFTKPIRLLITKKFHRAVSGGTGESKAAGNYAASLRAGEFAKQFGASQVLYLDAQNKYIEEAGAMNHYHIEKDGTVVIPEFTDTVLRSITSESIIELQNSLGLKVIQKRVALDEFIEKIKSKEIIEAGGFGTAAVVSPVGEYVFEDNSILTVGDGSIGAYSRKIYEYYTGLQTGKIAAPNGWLKKVEKRI